MTVKPSLAGILQRKGAATKPAEIPQRGAAAEAPATPTAKGTLSTQHPNSHAERRRMGSFASAGARE